MVNVISRSEWGAKPWRGTPYSVALNQRTWFLVHYHGGEPRNSVGVGVPREIEAIHLANGWSGVGYNFVVSQDGTVYEGRGWNLVGAHCPGHNTNGLGVYVAVGGDQAPTPEALAAVRALYDEACRRTGNNLRKSYHGYDYPTACPGPKLTAWVKAGMLVETGVDSVPTPPKTPSKSPTKKPATTKAPAFPLPRGYYFGPKSGPASSVSGYYSNRADLKKWQQRMKDRGWTITVDGLYGPGTARVARQFQKQARLAQDGLIGRDTWNAAWTEKVT